jgi:hypothetical protein
MVYAQKNGSKGIGGDVVLELMAKATAPYMEGAFSCVRVVFCPQMSLEKLCYVFAS